VRRVRRASGKAVWTWPSVVAADAGAMQIQLEEGERSEVYRGCAAEHGPSQRQAKRWLEQESMANTVVEEAWRQICLAQRQRGME
jgi:hypothetical protein